MPLEVVSLFVTRCQRRTLRKLNEQQMRHPSLGRLVAAACVLTLLGYLHPNVTSARPPIAAAGHPASLGMSPYCRHIHLTLIRMWGMRDVSQSKQSEVKMINSVSHCHVSRYKCSPAVTPRHVDIT